MTWRRKHSLLFFLILNLMDGNSYWDGTPSSLKATLEMVGRDALRIDPAKRCPGWPPDASSFSKAIAQLTHVLVLAGIESSRGYMGHQRAIRFHRV